MDAITSYEKAHLKKRVAKFQVGDEVEVHVRIIETADREDEGLSKTARAIKAATAREPKGPRERIQVFTGTVIARRGRGTGEMFTVRRIVQGEGVERTFPLHSPRVTRIRVRRRGRVRRAKLYYLRQRTGKATRLRETRVGLGPETDDGSAPAAETPTPETPPP